MILYILLKPISDASISPSNLEDGQRILMWSGKYLKISTTSPETRAVAGVRFNNANVTKVIKLTNGYLYLLDQAVESPRSLYEIMVRSRYVLTFDKNASTVIGVDKTGNTVYDSVFTVKAPYFENRKFNIMSENLTATMLLPSNDVVNQALSIARKIL